jgi:hypothetical protein
MRKISGNNMSEPTFDELLRYCGTANPNLLKTLYLGRAIPRSKNGQFIGIEVANASSV